ncbi:MAG TPA: metallopeptidase family protein [Acidobacteriota bacterium]|nr:metallopeptidase family protein [Acidobacteriota bacterium]
MEMREFEDTIGNALTRIPEQFMEILEREGIEVLAREKVPGVLRRKYRGGLLFGIFTGIPYNKRSMFTVQTEPTRIELYKNSFEEAFDNRGEMEEQIIKTVIHEIGHYFGFSEKQLRHRGL